MGSADSYVNFIQMLFYSCIPPPQRLDCFEFSGSLFFRRTESSIIRGFLSSVPSWESQSKIHTKRKCLEVKRYTRKKHLATQPYFPDRCFACLGTIWEVVNFGAVGNPRTSQG